MQVADVRKLIDGLRWDRRRHPYRGRREYSQRAQAVAAAVADMIEAGDAASAGPLARRAVERVTAALMYMDDSAGFVGDDLRALMVLYARACREAPPDARRLATWLVSSQLDGPGWPAIELKEFAAALGPRGLAEVARLTEARGVTAEPDSWTAQWGIKDLREQLAAVSGDIDAARSTNGGPFTRTTSRSARPPGRLVNGPVSAAGLSTCSATGPRPSSGTSES